MVVEVTRSVELLSSAVRKVPSAKALAKKLWSNANMAVICRGSKGNLWGTMAQPDVTDAVKKTWKDLSTSTTATCITKTSAKCAPS